MRRRNPRRSPRGAARPAPEDGQPTSWYRIENFIDRPDTAAVYIYEEIGYWGVTASDFVRDLQTVASLNLEVHINSPGGEVFDALAIFNALKQHRATVTVHIDGLAASAASFIAMAGDTVKISRNAQVMIHDAAGMEWGNAAQLRKMADLLDQCSDNIADIYSVKAGGTVEFWRQAMRNETWYTGPEAVAAGLADEIDGPLAATGEPGEDEEREEALVAARWDLSIFTYAGREKAPPPAMPRPAATAAEVPAAPEAPAVPSGPTSGADAPPTTPSIVVNIEGSIRSEQEIVDIIRDAFHRSNGTARAATTPTEDIEGEAPDKSATPDAPPAAEVTAEFDPAQKRDEHGRWTDGMPDTLIATSVNLHGGDLAMERHKDGTVTLTTEQGSVALPEGGNERLRKALNSAQLTEPGQTRKVRLENGKTAVLIERLDDDFLDIKVNPDWLRDDDLRATSGLRVTEDDLAKAELGSVRLDAAKRLDTGNGPVDLYLTDDNGFAFRMLDDSGAAIEKKFEGRSFAKISRAIDVVIEGFDDRVEDGPDISKVTVPTNLGDVDVELVGDQLRIVPADPGADWGVNVAGEHQGALARAFAQIEEIADDWLGVYETDEWKLAQLARRLLAQVEAAAADSWDSLTSGLLAPSVPDSWAALTGGLLTPATDQAWADMTEALL